MEKLFKENSNFLKVCIDKLLSRLEEELKHIK